MQLQAFIGIGGPIQIDTNGTRIPAFSIWAYNQSDVPNIYLTINVEDQLNEQYVSTYN